MVVKVTRELFSSVIYIDKLYDDDTVFAREAKFSDVCLLMLMCSMSALEMMIFSVQV